MTVHALIFIAAISAWAACAYWLLRLFNRFKAAWFPEASPDAFSPLLVLFSISLAAWIMASDANLSVQRTDLRLLLACIAAMLLLRLGHYPGHWIFRFKWLLRSLAALLVALVVGVQDYDLGRFGVEFQTRWNGPLASLFAFCLVLAMSSAFGMLRDKKTAYLLTLIVIALLSLMNQTMPGPINTALIGGLLTLLAARSNDSYSAWGSQHGASQSLGALCAALTLVAMNQGQHLSNTPFHIVNYLFVLALPVAQCALLCVRTVVNTIRKKEPTGPVSIDVLLEQAGISRLVSRIIICTLAIIPPIIGWILHTSAMPPYSESTIFAVMVMVFVANSAIASRVIEDNETLSREQTVSA